MQLMHAMTAVALSTVAAAAAVTLTANSAEASINDNHVLYTTDHHGAVNFVDYGPGVPGNGKANDDYLVIHDYKADGHGVKAWAWVSSPTTHGWLTFYLGGKYNGKGFAGPPVYWDPFYSLGLGSLRKGDKVGLKVCLVDGKKILYSTCTTKNFYMKDG